MSRRWNFVRLAKGPLGTGIMGFEVEDFAHWAQLERGKARDSRTFAGDGNRQKHTNKNDRNNRELELVTLKENCEPILHSCVESCFLPLGKLRQREG